MKTILFIVVFTASNLIFSAWQQVNGLNGLNIFCMTNTGGVLIAGSSTSILTNGNLYLSNDGGANWSLINTGFNLSGIFALEYKDNIVFAGTYEDGLFKSTNNGLNWLQVNINSNPNTGVFELGTSSMNLFAYTNTGQAYYVTTNNGNNWSVPAGMTGGVMNYLYNNNGTFYACTYKGLYRSTNNGFNWQQAGNNGLPTNPDGSKRLASVIKTGNTIFGSTIIPSDGIYKSTDEGNNWTNGGIFFTSDGYIEDFTSSGNMIFAGIYSGNSTEYGVLMTTNSGTGWTYLNNGLPQGVHINDLMVAGNYLYAATNQQGIWRININEITAVNSNSAVVNDFSLYQNYPNPFNPETKIKFYLPRGGSVAISVYDNAGELVEIMAQNEFNAGEHEVTFNAFNFASGVYYYSVQFENRIKTQKMVIIK